MTAVMKSYSELMPIIQIAITMKPSVGEDCNSCGWCCLTEVCPIGQDLTGSSVAPCKLLLSSNDNKHYCKLAENETTKEVLGIGTGCCAETRSEIICRIRGGRRE